MQSACFNLKLKGQICYFMYGLGKSMGFLILKSRVHRIQEKNINMPHPKNNNYQNQEKDQDFFIKI